MSDWWTYQLSDFLLFSPRTYYRLFALYNADIWPLQFVALVSGLCLFALWLTRGRGAGRAAAAILAVCWLFVAWAYLVEHYDTINWVAHYFAIGFVAEAVLIIWTGAVRNQLRLQPPFDPPNWGPVCLFGFALVVQPLIGPFLGRPWAQVELFGVAPDPTVVATMALLIAPRRPRWHLLIIPLIWCALTGATLWTMQSPDALIVPAAAVLALLLAAWKSLRRPPMAFPAETIRY